MRLCTCDKKEHAQTFVALDQQFYEPFLLMQNGKRVIYVQLLKALY
jgi:hypothetical protein